MARTIARAAACSTANVRGLSRAYLRSSSVSISSCGFSASKLVIRAPISFMWSVLRCVAKAASSV